ncbi:C-type lectin domain family 1 member B-like [Limanda limanda]|uniref:C-type lectin domain family 1 member B-like n=1 Tax=Limanda limanda TaxID=27771 RepID=UPI0029C74D1A|nr:C-type lectin domain family 1 member B-like [Limanda limanda]
MEEENYYDTLVFKNGGSPQKENDEDSTIYSTVKSKVPAATVTTGGAAAAHSRHFVLLLVCLGILCVLLIVCIRVIIYIFGVMKAHEEDRDDLNRTLRVIMMFQNFPVNAFCPQKKCKPCRESWIPFQDHCYLFYEQGSPWKTWTQARAFCQNTNADLVVVDSLQEQEFINKHTKFYHDIHHAYWMGLRQNEEKKWIWLDGRNETLGFWIQERVKNSGGYAMTYPGHNATASWGPAWDGFSNKFICEHEALIRTPVS